MNKQPIPENAIDRFFYKIKLAFIGLIKTIIESKVINKIIVKPMTTGPLSVILWYILIIFIFSMLVD